VQYLIRSRDYLRVQSFDELAVVLYVAAYASSERGVTEKRLANELGIPLSTINRVMKRLLDGGQVLIIPDASPREYMFNVDFSKSAYGNKAQVVRDKYYMYVLEGFADVSRSIIKNLVQSQYEKIGD
jgi:DNA-binding transcriptional regulator LsrR (DeoR family)